MARRAMRHLFKQGPSTTSRHLFSGSLTTVAPSSELNIEQTQPNACTQYFVQNIDNNIKSICI